MSEDKLKADYPFLSGLLLGWSSSLKDPNQVSRVIKDLEEWSKKLAKKARVKFDQTR